MPIPASINDLSTTASLNSPSGSDSPGILDDIQRAHASFIATLRDRAANISGINKLINGNFAINNRGVSGTVTLAAGAYGHDRWKAGASGCTYTFAPSGIDTVITITAGSLMQVIEDKNVDVGTYSLSHAGTAQARIAVNGAATSGSYAAATTAAPLQSAIATANQTITVEFGIGTVSKAQLEMGTTASSYERRDVGIEKMMCKRYLPVMKSSSVVDFICGGGRTLSATDAVFVIPHTVEPRVVPTGIIGSSSAHFTINAATGGGVATALTFLNGGLTASRIQVTSSGMTAGQLVELYFNNASAFLLFTGCEL